MSFDYSNVKEYKFYDIVKPLIRFMSAVRFKLKYVGEENIPESGGFILAGNHIFLFDPAVILSRCKRPCHFMAKSEFFDNPVLGFLLKELNAFPVKRGLSDKKALKYAKDIISKGWILGIFPEGTRIKSLIPGKAKNGIGFLARDTGADVLPVCLYRSPDNKKKRGNLTVRFGKLIEHSEFGFTNEKNSAEVRNASAKIMDSITKMWEEENCR